MNDTIKGRTRLNIYLPWIITIVSIVILIGYLVGGFRIATTFDAVSYWSLLLSVVSLIFGIVAMIASFYFYEKGNEANREATKTLEEIRTSAREATERIDKHFERVLSAYIDRPTISQHISSDQPDPFEGFLGRVVEALEPLKQIGPEVSEQVKNAIADALDKQQEANLPKAEDLEAEPNPWEEVRKRLRRPIKSRIIAALKEADKPITINEIAGRANTSFEMANEIVMRAIEEGELMITSEGIYLPQIGPEQ